MLVGIVEVLTSSPLERSRLVLWSQSTNYLRWTMSTMPSLAILHLYKYKYTNIDINNAIHTLQGSLGR